MNTTFQDPTNKELLLTFQGQVSELRTKVEGFPEAARMEAVPRVERLEVMIAALARDLKEIGTPGGADDEQTSKLTETIDRELSNLIPELEALSLGNETTISAVLDSSMHLVEKAGAAVKELTSKIPGVRKSE